MNELTQERLKELIQYDPLTGIMTWRLCRGKRWSGKEAGTTHAEGYINIKIDYDMYSTHRLAFLYMTGEWPKDCIDHINGERGDNRWCNLRKATRFENLRNSKKYTNNTSGHKGVSWHKGAKRWVAYIRHGGRLMHLGSYHDVVDAANAVKIKREELHGEFCNHG